MLRLSLYEIKYRLDVPPVVAIDEALEIGKEFSSEKSGKFLNGVRQSQEADRETRKETISLNIWLLEGGFLSYSNALCIKAD